MATPFVELESLLVNGLLQSNVNIITRDKFKLITRWCALLIALIAGVHETYAQTANTATMDMGFEQRVPGWMKETNVPAVGIGLIENGKLKYVKVFGELKKGTPAPLNTIFKLLHYQICR